MTPEASVLHESSVPAGVVWHSPGSVVQVLCLVWVLQLRPADVAPGEHTVVFVVQVVEPPPDAVVHCLSTQV
jgi:hypothetical protein